MMLILSGMNYVEWTNTAAIEWVCFDFECRPTVFYTTWQSCDNAQFCRQVAF